MLRHRMSDINCLYLPLLFGITRDKMLISCFDLSLHRLIYNRALAGFARITFLCALNLSFACMKKIFILSSWEDGRLRWEWVEWSKSTGVSEVRRRKVVNFLFSHLFSLSHTFSLKYIIFHHLVFRNVVLVLSCLSRRWLDGLYKDFSRLSRLFLFPLLLLELILYVFLMIVVCCQTP